MHIPVNSSILSHFTTEGCALDLFHCAFSEVSTWNRPALRNTYWRCYLPVSGIASIHSTTRTWRMRENEVIIIPPDSPVWGEAKSLFTLFYTHFNCSIRVTKPIPLTLCVDQDILMMLDRAVRQRDSVMFRTAMLRLVATALASIPSSHLRTTPVNHYTREAFQFMKENLDRKLKNQEIARQLRMSEASLLRLFRRTVGNSPQKEHLRFRLNHAADLLQKTDQSIEQIAAACGFWDRNHFTRVFTREWKTSPSKYRHAPNPL